MIAIDSSALVAILEGEADGAAFADAMGQADRVLISAMNVLETGTVLRARHGLPAVERMWRFLLEENDVEIVAFDETQAREALSAFARYGKGLNPKARLNICDCAAYALAKSLNAPLLFKGNDFVATDLVAALRPV